MESEGEIISVMENRYRLLVRKVTCWLAVQHPFVIKDNGATPFLDAKVSFVCIKHITFIVATVWFDMLHLWI